MGSITKLLAAASLCIAVRADAQSWVLGGVRLTLGEDERSVLGVLKGPYELRLEKSDDVLRYASWDVLTREGQKIGSIAFAREKLASIERWYGGSEDPISRLHQAMMDLQDGAGLSCKVGGITATSFAGITCGQFNLQWGKLRSGEVWIWLSLRRKPDSER